MTDVKKTPDVPEEPSEEAPEPPPPPPPRPQTYFEKFFSAVGYTFIRPVEILHDNFVVPDRKPYEWYHTKYRRVPTIDECYEEDPVCFAEANIQYKRDRLVDSEIVTILRQRFENCVMYETPHHLERCAAILKEYDDASNNWFIKYGDLGGYHNVLTCYMKQKHRLLWESKYGEVGSGMGGEGDEGGGGAGGDGKQAAGEIDPCKDRPDNDKPNKTKA